MYQQEVQKISPRCTSEEGSWAGVASDHHLVITRVKLKLKRNSSVTTRRQRYNVSLLRENENEQRTRTDFTISSKFNDPELEGEGDIPGMKHKWRNVKEVLNFTCEEVVGFRKHQHKEGICISRDITVVISPTRPSTIFFHFENYVLVDVNQMHP